MSEKKKIYAIVNGGSPQYLRMIAVCEDGHVLAQHMSSDEAWGRHDLGIGSNWKHERYDAHCGQGNWELEWVETDCIDDHEGIKKAIELNKMINKETV